MEKRNNYFKVTAKCGHVGKNHYIPIPQGDSNGYVQFANPDDGIVLIKIIEVLK